MDIIVIEKDSFKKKREQIVSLVPNMPFLLFGF
ncbi:hypothetical protein GGR21_000622 [Dysgonomonas hofstadii]|uniref:Uncharacterized protein n=1 Tax=Dysgonomonas hofstadii TaxID=637886 RepID=A0A840CP34_9BACT|nr:hypothetical protein [Dysgonomonas hofstadii]